jgi:hypothetical protein
LPLLKPPKRKNRYIPMFNQFFNFLLLLRLSVCRVHLRKTELKYLSKP